MDKNSHCSLFYVNGNNQIKTEIKGCSFSGSLSEDSFFIDGQSYGNLKINLHLKDCKFDSDKRFHFNSKFINVKLDNQLFNCNKLINICACSAIIFAGLAMILKKSGKFADETENYDLTFIKDDNESPNNNAN